MLCVWAIPYGLGAGAIDAALNNYVALHYSSRHMNWLHCFWGVGATLGPFVMGYYLTNNLSWNSGYRTISYIQIALVVVMLISLPLWKQVQKGLDVSSEEEAPPLLKLSQIIKIKGVKHILTSFFAYCGMEATTFLWASTYLVRHRGIEAEVAAGYAALFFIGLTVGRFLSGIISDKVGDRNMIRLGIVVILIGIVAVWLPVSADWPSLYGLVVIGFGCAPIYPAIIHSTPENFGKENSPSIIGVQMASAYMGTTLMPPLFGFLANRINFGIMPAFLLVFAVLMLFMTERLNKVVKN
jgi:fucose permease